jgi:transcriptional regulator with XRE-family HTH domain
VPHRDICKRFGLRLRRLRERKGWDQVDLAAESGLSRETISIIENGRVDLRLRTLEALAGSFKMTVAQLMRGV